MSEREELNLYCRMDAAAAKRAREVTIQKHGKAFSVNVIKFNYGAPSHSSFSTSTNTKDRNHLLQFPFFASAVATPLRKIFFSDKSQNAATYC